MSISHAAAYTFSETSAAFILHLRTSGEVGHLFGSADVHPEPVLLATTQQKEKVFLSQSG